MPLIAAACNLAEERVRGDMGMLEDDGVASRKKQ
jgi:hypothetical protein